jgi:hypothetical protein
MAVAGLVRSSAVCLTLRLALGALFMVAALPKLSVD